MSRRFLTFLLTLSLLLPQILPGFAHSPGFRDLTRIDEITSDKITGALDATMSVDNRVFTGAGWASIASDVENFWDNLFKAGEGAGKGAVYTLGVFGDVLASIGQTFTGTAGLDPTDLPKVIHDKVSFQQVVAELPKTCPTCVDWLAGENFDPDESKAIQKKIAETARIHGLTVNEFLIMAEGNGLYGLHNGNDGGTVVVDMLKPGGKEFSSGKDRVFTLGHEAPGHSSGGDGEDYANLMGNFALGAMNLSNWLNGRESLSDSGMSATEWMSAYGDSEFIRNNNAWADFLATQKDTKNSGLYIIEPNDLKKVELGSKLTSGRISQEEYDKQMQFLAGKEQGYDQAGEEWLSRERPSILDRDFWLIPEEVLKSGDPVAIGRSEAQLSQNLVELYGGVRAIQYLLAQMQATPAFATNNQDKWSSTRNLTSEQNASNHWDKHGKEFPGIRTKDEYVQRANEFVTNPPEGTLTRVRASGEIVYYEPKTNTFAVKNVNGAPKTMFKPKNGIIYFNRQ